MEIKCPYPRCAKMIEMSIEEPFSGCPFCLTSFRTYGIDVQKHIEVEEFEETQRFKTFYALSAPFIIVIGFFMICDGFGFSVPSGKLAAYSLFLTFSSSVFLVLAWRLVIKKRVDALRKKLGIRR